MVKNLPPRLRDLMKLKTTLAGPSNRGLGKTVSAVAAGSEAEGRAEGRSGLWRAKTEDGSRLRGMPVDMKQPLLEHPNGADSPRSL